MAVQSANNETFNELLSNNPKVVVKYFANWCGSCKLIKPKYRKLSEKEEYNDVIFLDVNAEESPEARKLAGVTNLPFFATFQNGTLADASATAKIDAVEEMVQKL